MPLHRFLQAVQPPFDADCGIGLGVGGIDARETEDLRLFRYQVEPLGIGHAGLRKATIRWTVTKTIDAADITDFRVMFIGSL